MREEITRLLLAGLLVFMGCAGPKLRARSRAELSRYRRFGVLPFNDNRGRGKQVADAVARGLWSLQLDVLSSSDMETVFTRLGIRAGAPFGAEELADIRKMTQADAMVFGAVDCRLSLGVGTLTLLILDTAGGAPILSAKLRTDECASAAGDKAMAALVVSKVRAALKRGRSKR